MPFNSIALTKYLLYRLTFICLLIITDFKEIHVSSLDTGTSRASVLMIKTAVDFGLMPSPE